MNSGLSGWTEAASSHWACGAWGSETLTQASGATRRGESGSAVPRRDQGLGQFNGAGLTLSSTYVMSVIEK